MTLVCPLQFDLQQAHIYCDPELVLEEGCCEILPGGVSGLDPHNRWTRRFEVGWGQAAKERMHFWEWKQHVSRGVYTQRIHRQQHDHQPRGSRSLESGRELAFRSSRFSGHRTEIPGQGRQHRPGMSGIGLTSR